MHLLASAFFETKNMASTDSLSHQGAMQHMQAGMSPTSGCTPHMRAINVLVISMYVLVLSGVQRHAVVYLICSLGMCASRLVCCAGKRCQGVYGCAGTGHTHASVVYHQSWRYLTTSAWRSLGQCFFLQLCPRLDNLLTGSFAPMDFVCTCACVQLPCMLHLCMRHPCMLHLCLRLAALSLLASFLLAGLRGGRVPLPDLYHSLT